MYRKENKKGQILGDEKDGMQVRALERRYRDHFFLILTLS